MRAAVIFLFAVAISATASAQRPCDQPRASTLVEAGWQRFRAGRMAAADSSFLAAIAACPGDPGATIGRGYVALREGRRDAARRAFETALHTLPRNHDALSGLGLAAWQSGDLPAARDAFRRVLEIAPDDSTARSYLDRIPAPVDSTRLPVRVRPDSVDLRARTGVRRFEVRSRGGAWSPLWIKAVNLGAALPGKNPSEFPADNGMYDGWIALVARMGANAVRVYTIHPPHFYRALSQWNAAHPDSALWLIHGVWTELPPDKLESDYDNVTFNAEFRGEMRNVVNALHGHAAIQPRPGHASGLYDTDVSHWVLGYIVGREWEPYSVVAYAKRHPTKRDFTGTYVNVRGGNALDVWLAQFCDAMIAYEMDRYNSQRPIAYTNWPTLDPLRHPTESSRAEETRWLKQRGEVAPEPSKEYDNDAIALDATHWQATTKFSAGVFASFHAYPYYPDFMVFDPGYARAQSPWGPSNYFGYVQDLVAHHGDMPVVISEYGVPSSRGDAHMQPQGYDHGGHDEQAQARIDATLTREIHAAGAAGAGLFAVIDEWFKRNWMEVEFEQPADRNRLWLNPLDAEQHYGIVAMRPGVKDSAITIDGDPSDWRGRPPLLRDTTPSSRPAPERVRALYVTHDEAYVYLRLSVDSIDWARAHYLIGIDTYGRALGDTKLPYTGARVPSGLEFVVDLRGPDNSRVLVDSPYLLYDLRSIVGARPPAVQAVINRPLKTVANADGRYDTLRVIPNRRRIGRDGTVYPERSVDRNALRFARQQETTLADWYADPNRGTIEIRLPWGMLHVLDPSSRRVLFGTAATHPTGVATDGFKFVVMSYNPKAPTTSGVRLPAGAATTFAASPLWTWPTWETPRWYAEVKPVFESMREVYRAIQ